MLIRGHAIVSRRANGLLQRTAATHWTIWLSPSGVTEEFMVMSQDLLEVLHIYLPQNPFVVLESSEATAALEKVHCATTPDFTICCSNKLRTRS